MCACVRAGVRACMFACVCVCGGGGLKGLFGDLKYQIEKNEFRSSTENTKCGHILHFQLYVSEIVLLFLNIINNKLQFTGV